jgi:hypothetical protein
MHKTLAGETADALRSTGDPQWTTLAPGEQCAARIEIASQKKKKWT